MSFIQISGTKVVEAESGKEIVLRGAGLGGWMMMENFITGFPGCEFQIRAALSDVLGESKATFFFDKFLEYFFTEADAIFFKSLGLNCIRIAINYKHFEGETGASSASHELLNNGTIVDDMNPRFLKATAFAHLDRVISLCAKHSIYTVIDMHTAPGGQSGGWHCDSGTHIAKFWVHKDFQDRLIWLWTEIAAHYRDNPWIAGYNVLNEPADPHPSHAGLINFYDRACGAIRSVDQHHALYLDGNTFATDFSKFPDDVKKRWGENVAYSIHDYSVFGFPKSKEVYEGNEEQKTKMRSAYERKRHWMDERGLCVWNGEWGPVYGRREYDGDATDEINRRRYMVLRDQLEIYRKDELSWSIWLYKDIGYQGMVYVSPSTPYMKLFKDFLAKKQRLSVDAWGADDRFVKHIYNPIIQLIKDTYPDDSQRKLYPPIWSTEERVTRIARTMLVAEFMVKEWAEMFRGMDEEKLDELAKSFLFETCEKRDGLNQVLMENAAL